MKPPEATKNVPTQSHPLSPHFFESEERGRFLAGGCHVGAQHMLEMGRPDAPKSQFSMDALMIHDKY